MYSEKELNEFHKKCQEGNLVKVKNALSKHPSNFINKKGKWGKSIFLLKLFLF